ncbi:MAG: phosphonopyruvate decarboxylase [Candidatus Lokiarchaeota archaeon]|nr:phosphonopyruvate decarboxylase [Candidatus Lokiarchaeota archaeon]
MIKSQDFFTILKENDLTFFTGIPDSTFKEWIKFIIKNDPDSLQNIVACNECEAIAIATGYHLATNKIGIVYMQNSGLGKTVNPLTSLCDKDVYSIPILMMIGWRGEPGIKDAPQHKKMGKITLSLLDTLQIPYKILEPDIKLIQKHVSEAIIYLKEHKGPFALIIRPNLFQKYSDIELSENTFEISREEAITFLMENLTSDDIIISSTGHLSRELYEYREKREKDHYKSFYNIGSMGCASSIGLGIALQKPNKKIVVFDGDGAAIMQFGTFTSVGKYKPKNFIHVIFNNNTHESTGGQPTNSDSVNFCKVALASNYNSAYLINTLVELSGIIPEVKKGEGPILIVINIKRGTKANLKRPHRNPEEYKEDFMKFLTEYKEK